MTDYVRVREGDWEYSIPEHRLADGLNVLDKDALAPSGKPLPPKPVTPLGTPRAGSKQERSRATKEAATKKTTGASGPGETAGQKSAALEQEN